jgi:hypothetical protein
MNAAFPFSIFGLFCPFVAIVFIVTIVLLIIRAAVDSGSSGVTIGRRTRAKVLTELAEDGFWIVSCPANPNAMLQYHYWAGGVRRMGQVPFQPDPNGRQFIYTGVRPEQATIVRILEDDEDMSSALVPPLIATQTTFLGTSANDDQDTPGPTASPPSFPSAY